MLSSLTAEDPPIRWGAVTRGSFLSLGADPVATMDFQGWGKEVDGGSSHIKTTKRRWRFRGDLAGTLCEYHMGRRSVSWRLGTLRGGC